MIIVFFNFVIEHIYKPLECIYLPSNSNTKKDASSSL